MYRKHKLGRRARLSRAKATGGKDLPEEDYSESQHSESQHNAEEGGLAADASKDHAAKKGRGGTLLRDCIIMLLAFCSPIFILEFISPTKPTAPGQPGGIMGLWNKWVGSGNIALSSPGAAISQALHIPVSAKTMDTTKPKSTDIIPRKIPSATNHPKAVEAPPLDPNDTTIAYVIPLWDCGEVLGMAHAEAAMMVRHSIHQQSSRTPTSGSRYDYQMYALILNRNKCPTVVLKSLGFKVVTVEAPPVELSQINNPYLQDNMNKQGGGGINQFVQLLAHDIAKEQIIVVLYPNTLVLKPLDELFTAMLYPASTPQGQNARAELSSKLERPTDELPDQIDHYFVRDYPNAGYGRQPVVMTPGFWVARRNPALIPQAVALAKAGNYIQGNGQEHGWGGKGYTAYFRFGMTFPGFYTYFLDTFYPATTVELSGCKFNHNGMDNLFRAAPRFHPAKAKEHAGKCRSTAQECGDCTTTDIGTIYTVVYDKTCFAPRHCYGEGTRGGDHSSNIDTQCTTVEHCLILQKEWHTMRATIEDLLAAQPAFESLKTKGRQGTYKPEIFQGHCEEHGKDTFIALKTEQTDRGLSQVEFTWNNAHQIPLILWGETVAPPAKRWNSGD